VAREGKLGNAEKFLLGITALFLAGLCGLSWQDRRAAEQVDEMVTTAVEVPQEVVAPGFEPLDLNRATAEELEQLPGIGEKLSAQIVAYRDRHGAFETVEELMQIDGIGEGTMNNLRDYVTVG